MMPEYHLTHIQFNTARLRLTSRGNTTAQRAMAISLRTLMLVMLLMMDPDTPELAHKGITVLADLIPRSSSNSSSNSSSRLMVVVLVVVAAVTEVISNSSILRNSRLNLVPDTTVATLNLLWTEERIRHRMDLAIHTLMFSIRLEGVTCPRRHEALPTIAMLLPTR
jgi:hypothetical protein